MAPNDQIPDDSGKSATKQTSKTVFDNSAQANVSQAAFTYDLQGRLHTATITSFTAGNESRIERTTYDYDATGIRVSALHEIDTDANGTRDVTTRTEYLVDHRNFTGYQQVIKEALYDANGNAVKTIEYNFGHDEISQTVTEFDAAGQVTAKHTEIFGHDGHGSVKVLYDAAAAILQVYTYEAYGQMLAIHNAIAAVVTTGALTSLQYSGEQFDSRIGQQYLRERYYDPNTGRFNRLDPFAGNSQDPQSFHKYAYTHGNPVMGVDPTGLFLGTIGGLFSAASSLQQTLSVAFAGLGTYNTAMSLVHAIEARNDLWEGDLWGVIFNTALSIMSGVAAALDFMTAVSILKIPPVPPAGLVVGIATEAGVARQMVLNPAFEAWIIGNVVPVAVLGVANLGILLASRHEMDWEIRDSRGRIKARGHETSGGTQTGTRPTRAQQQKTHTERKFIEKAESSGKLQEGDIVTLRGEQPMCKPGNPRSNFGTGDGCQVHMQRFSARNKVTSYYTDAAGNVIKIRPNGELVKPDGTVIPAPP